MLHLCDRAGICHSGYFPELLRALLLGQGIKADSLVYQLPVDGNPTVVDVLAVPVFLPDEVRGSNIPQGCGNLHFHLYIALVVGYEGIIDLADVGRTTFYTHFETKDALLESFCAEIFEHVFSEELAKEKTHDFSGEHDTKARVTHILYHLQEHIEYLPGILTGDSDAVFMGYFKERFSGLFAQTVQQSKTVPYDYMLNHMVNDFAETIRWWAEHSQYSPEEISAFFFETTQGIK